MATEEDLKKAEDEAAVDDEAEEAEAREAHERAEKPAERAEDEIRPESEPDKEEAADMHVSAPVQLGYQRYVYAAYMAGAMLIAFLAAKIGHVAWYRLGQWKAEFGEPKDELVYPVAAVIGMGVAVYYWRKQEARQYANEVAEELSKVTWPTRKEVWNSTTVVVLTTIVMTVFFALMDQFWKYVTDKIYSF